jgi:hypothetical protein
MPQQHHISKDLILLAKKIILYRSQTSIDWLVAQRSSGSISLSRQRWLSKWTTGICGVGKWLHHWKWQDHSNCPQCGQPNEDVQHVLLCNKISAVTLWESLLSDLDQWLQSNACDLEMKTAICQSLRSWHNGSPLVPIQSHNRNLTSAIMQQDNLSWYSFLCGFLAKGWRQVQHEHLLHIGSQKSSILWTTKLQRRIWIIPWSMWEHRNHQLHNDGSSIHQTDHQSITSEIIREWTLGVNGLSERH